MAEEGRTIREWASCEVRWEDQEGEIVAVMVAQDGSFNDAIVTDFEGQCVLTLRDGRGIDEHAGTWHVDIVHDPLFLFPAVATLEHINDQDKRVRLFVAPETLQGQPFVLTMFQYTAVRSTAGGS